MFDQARKTIYLVNVTKYSCQELGRKKEIPPPPKLPTLHDNPTDY
jgi:hypothetical protein